MWPINSKGRFSKTKCSYLLYSRSLQNPDKWAFMHCDVTLSFTSVHTYLTSIWRLNRPRRVDTSLLLAPNWDWGYDDKLDIWSYKINTNLFWCNIEQFDCWFPERQRGINISLLSSTDVTGQVTSWNLRSGNGSATLNSLKWAQNQSATLEGMNCCTVTKCH